VCILVLIAIIYNNIITNVTVATTSQYGQPQCCDHSSGS